MTGDGSQSLNERAPLICVMGVSAAGKSVVGAALAERLEVPFLDSDSLHPDANRAKMIAGVALTDDDRWAWLDAVGESFEAAVDTGLVIACSALKKVYRDRISAIAPGVVFVHLHGSRELLHERATARTDHFMPASLLGSQLDALENLGSDEPGFAVDIARTPPQLVDEIIAALDRRRSGAGEVSGG